MTRTARPIRVEGDIAYVTLTRGYEAMIDAADVPLVSGVCWCAEISGKTVYAVRTDQRSGKKRRIYMHHVICPPSAGMEVDHRDCNGLNNRRGNVRLATRQQNVCNQTVRRDNKAGLRGVSWFEPARKWRARISANGKSCFLGYFDTSDAAKEAYASASAELHGDFGRTA